ncbi:NAD(P)H-dependent oxidoreductase [Myxococcaceae bacterium GXIMD 01537]
MTTPETQPSLKLLGIAGSLRRQSFNRFLLEAVREELPPNVSLTLFDRLGDVPLYNADVEAQGVPEPVAALREAIRAADGLLIATPEYNYSVPGVLKNALDWASRPPATSALRGKPVGIIGASMGMSGTMRAQYHLRQVFVFTNSPVMPQPEVILARAQERFDAEGRLTDASTRELLRKFGISFEEWVRRFK